MNPYIQYMYSYPHKTAYRTLEGIFLQDYAHLLSGSKNSLYLHLPFCQSKCGYCNLFSVTGQTASAFSCYLDAVERQARQYQELFSDFHPAFTETAIGGGTPLLLPQDLLERMFRILDTYFYSGAERELAIETAPNQTSREKLQILKQAGATRVSMGIQSFCDQELQALGRQHQARKAREALALLKSFGFPCINVDFIYGIPGQTIESLLTSLKEALAFEPDEIFLYPLYLKHGAWLPPSPVSSAGHTAYRQYQEASAFLRGEDYRQDSMRRFVKLAVSSPQEQRPFSECGFGTSLALGCGGRSYLGNLHFCTPYAVTAGECSRQLRRFMDTEDFSRITHGILLSEDEMKRRYAIRHLLIRPGLDIQRYQQTFHSQALEDFPLLQDWIRQGYAILSPANNTDYLTLTEEGLGLSDCLGPQLISPQIRTKMEEWEAALSVSKDEPYPQSLP